MSDSDQRNNFDQRNLNDFVFHEHFQPVSPFHTFDAESGGSNVDKNSYKYSNVVPSILVITPL